MTTPDPWHYSRAELARHYVSVLDTGVTPRLTLFAPRRMGKTEFLLRDLAPAADAAGYDVLYINLWANPDAPHETILAALRAAIDRRKRKRPVRNILETEVRKLKLEGLFGLGAEIEFPDNPRPAPRSALTEIDALLKELVRGRGRVLILMDEIQHLATRPAFESLTYALRTALDVLQGQVKVVFTGSSRAGIRSMFGRRTAPFHHFSDQMEFPNLGRDFVEFLATVYTDITGRKLNAGAAWRVFERLDHNPFLMRAVLKALVLDPGVDVEQAYGQVIDAVALENNYPQLWARLNPLDRAVFQALTDNRPPYGRQQLAAYKRQTGRQAVSVPTVQKSLRRLIDAQLISPGDRGEYLIEAPGLAAWCAKREA